MDASSVPLDTYFDSMRFSTSFQSTFLQPLFAGITLDDERKERSAFASFTFSAMSHGFMTMPKHGIEAVPRQVFDRLESSQIMYNAKVASVSKKSIKLEDGTTMKADMVICNAQHVTQAMLETHRQHAEKKRQRMSSNPDYLSMSTIVAQYRIWE